MSPAPGSSSTPVKGSENSRYFRVSETGISRADLAENSELAHPRRRASLLQGMMEMLRGPSITGPRPVSRAPMLEDIQETGESGKTSKGSLKSRNSGMSVMSSAGGGSRRGRRPSAPGKVDPADRITLQSIRSRREGLEREISEKRRQLRHPIRTDPSSKRVHFQVRGRRLAPWPRPQPPHPPARALPQNISPAVSGNSSAKTPRSNAGISNAFDLSGTTLDGDGMQGDLSQDIGTLTGWQMLAQEVWTHLPPGWRALLTRDVHLVTSSLVHPGDGGDEGAG